MTKKKRKRNRANGEGWINLRADGRYDVGLSIHTAEGLKRVRTTKRLYAEADAWLTEQKSRRGLGLAFDAAKLTFAEYLERWLEYGVKGSVKDGTYLVHRSNVRRHLSPALGTMKLSKLTPAHFQGLYQEKLKTLSARTVLGIHASATKALNQAVRWELVTRNAAVGARPPKPQKKKVKALSGEQARALLEAASGRRLRAMYALALATGARHGELLALTWEDVAFGEDGAEVAIRETVTRALPKKEGGESFTTGTPKTGEERVVSVGPKAATALKEHRLRQKEEKLAYDAGRYHESGRVFTSENGYPLSERRSSREFRAVCREAKLPDTVGMHTLRHTYATLHLVGGTPAKVVSEGLGHTTIAQTIDTYSHLTPTMQKEAAARLDEALF